MVKKVSYRVMCDSQRASLGYHSSTRNAPSSSQSPMYHAPDQSPPVIDLSPMPVQGIEDSPSQELVMEIDALSNLPLPNHE